MHLNSKLLFDKYGLPKFKDGMKVLEVAPSSYPSPYQKAVNNSSIQWDSIDFVDTKCIDQNAISNLTYELKSPYTFPIPDNSYDIILSGQVMEHVEKIWTWLKELKRVVRDGGKIITISPVSWPYHEAPVDCWRIYPSAVHALADEIGLTVELAKFESLEEELLKGKDPNVYTVAGRSYDYIYLPEKLSNILRWNKFIRHVPKARVYLQIPVEVAFDNISILQKGN